MAWPSAPVVAQAAGTTSASAASTCLLGLVGCTTAASSSPSPNCLLGLIGCGGASGPTSGPCVGGLVLCGGNVVNQPSPCVSGSLLCSSSPPPTPCTAGQVLCPGTILGGGDQPPPGGTNVKRNPATVAGSSPPLPGTTNISVALGGPPGVCLGPAALGPFGVSGPNPDAFPHLLSLPIPA